MRLNIKRTVFTLYVFYFKCTKSANIFLSAIVHVAVAICAQIIMDAELQWQLFFFAQFSKSGVGM